MTFSKNILLILGLILFIGFQNSSYSQMSKKEIEKERALYKSNNIKKVNEFGGKGYYEVTEVDREGRKIKSNGFYNDQEVNITIYEYDLNGRLYEESYYGYESGDGLSFKYSYDDEGNVKSILSEGVEESNIIFKYDEFGNVISKEIEDIGLYPQPSYIIEFENTYEDGILISISQKCNSTIELAEFTEYDYNEGLLNSKVEYYKNCYDRILKFSSKSTYTYYPNKLIEQVSLESTYNESIQVSNFRYEYYK